MIGLLHTGLHFCHGSMGFGLRVAVYAGSHLRDAIYGSLFI